ncbi:MAG: NAD(+) synthase [Flavobacteriales bacterium]|jgi:NAD+ synthase|nr:NAD(+) synthase [Flavobacteriales bacterium]
MQTKAVIDHIVNWLKEYKENSGTKGFVVGISGGIDSALTSTLCGLTGAEVVCVNMPIHQFQAELDRSEEHIAWLEEQFGTQIQKQRIDLTNTFETLKKSLPEDTHTHLNLANVRARIRMTTLYALAGSQGKLVAGTGNKVEDFGVGFFTKYGDGGVDLSPIADLTKTEVYALAKELGVPQSIQKAAPTDGLWEDGRSDEDQIGASYPELEWAMQVYNEGKKADNFCGREKEVFKIYERMHRSNLHKMKPIPVCEIPVAFK